MTNKTYKKIAILLAIGAILAVGGYVAALYGASGPDAAPNLSEYGLVGFWNMEEGKGQTVYDRSGNANNGTLGASTSVAKDDPVFTSGYSSSGPGGTGLKFDGVNDYVNAGNGASLNIAGAITIEAWVKIANPNLNRYMRIVDKKLSWDANNGYIFEYNPSENIVYILGSGTNWGSASSVNLDTNWHHLAGIINGTVATIYVDGINSTTDSTITALASGVQNLNIGRSNANIDYFNGSIDEVRIYNRALSADEIRQHYNQKKPVLEMKFDEGSGQKAYDESFNNNDATFPAADANKPSWSAP